MNLHCIRTVAGNSAAIIALFAFALPAAAQWTGKGEAGLAIASCNSDTKTANAKVAIGRKIANWEHSAGLAGLYVRNDGDTTAKRWETFLQTHYNFGGGKTFWFGGTRYEKDRFSGFDHQGVFATGMGHKFIDTEATRLSGQAGVGYKFWEVIGTPSDKDSSVVGTAGLDFRHQLTGTTSVFNKFGAEVASDNNFLQDELGFAVKVSDRIALSLGYAVRHNTDPPAGFRKTDTLSTVNLVYEVK